LHAAQSPQYVIVVRKLWAVAAHGTPFFPLGDDAPVMLRIVQHLFKIIAAAMLALNVAQAAPVDMRTPRQAASVTQPGIEDPTGAMNGFYESLTRTQHGEAFTRILHYGDSHVAADLLTGALRRAFQSRFGNAGAGFILAGKPYTYYSRPGVTIQASGGWHVNGLSDASLPDDGRFGLAGISFTAAERGESFEITAPASRFDLYLLKQPGGGAVTISLDGVVCERSVSLASARSEAAYVEVSAATDASHSLEVTIDKPGAVRALGVDVGRDTPGVVYDALGINGARMMRMLAWDWRILSSNLMRSDPDLIVIAYGSNEVGDSDLNLNEYGNRFYALLTQLHEAVPRASLLVIAPPDRAVKMGSHWQTIDRLPALIATQRRAATRAGAAFFDLFHAMGGNGSITRWAALAEPLARHDHVHLTAAGYRTVADWVYQAMLRGWQASEAKAQAPRFNR
jgi:lysophospholipase L1-like esterase